MMDEKTKEFLTKFYKHLRNDYWGDIDPEYFNPEQDDDISKDALLIHHYVEDSLKEKE